MSPVLAMILGGIGGCLVVNAAWFAFLLLHESRCG